MSLYDSASLVMIPSGVKEDKLYSIKPTDGSGDFTFSRGSDIQATRVNSSGLIEKAKENLLLQSNQFDTTWTTSSASVTGGQSGYDGSSDAWLLTATSTSNCRVNQSIGGSGVQSISVYAKANTSNFLAINAIVSGTNTIAYFDLSSGAVGTTGGTPIDADIESVGGGWYRCSLVYNDTNTQMRFLITDGDGSSAVTNGNSIYIQDAQLNHGLIAQDYVETTTTAVVEGLTADLPRLDYSGGASCPSLLLEPSRTNLVTQSEYLDGLTKVRVSVTSNDATSPEGVINASKVIEANDVNLEHTLQSNTIAYTSGQVLSGSVFAKAGERDFVRLSFSGYGNWVGGGGAQVTFDLTNGTATPTSGSTPTDYGIEDYGNGWYRCYIVGTANTTSSSRFNQILCTDVNTNVYDGDGTSGLYLYGSQCELASYPTSYIPTYGTAAVRAQDEATKTSATDLIGQTEGTLFFQVNQFPKEFNGRVLAITQNSSNYISIFKNGTNDDFRVLVSVGGSGVVDYQGTSTLPSNTKIAVGYANNDFVIYINGTQVHTDTSGSVPTCSNIFIGKRENGTTTYSAGGGLKQALLFKARLTNAELAALTTI